MPRTTALNANDKALVQRYLIWCYKTTKEDLDRIDRKFTQLLVDRFILKHLEGLRGPNRTQLRKFIGDFKIYMSEKRQGGLRLKYLNAKKSLPEPKYVYLSERLKAIKSAIRHFLGPRMLSRIEALYEQEMTRRILESREH